MNGFIFIAFYVDILSVWKEEKFSIVTVVGEKNLRPPSIISPTHAAVVQDWFEIKKTYFQFWDQTE